MDRKKIIILGIVLVVLLILGIGGFVLFKNNNDNIKTKEEIDDNKIIDINDSDKELTFSFLKLENNKKNMIYSPLSIKYAISMLQQGAEGNTKVEIDNLLKDVNLTKYNNIEDKLSLANAIFIRDTFKNDVNNTFITNVESKYNAEIKYDSFNNAKNINKWINDKTLGLLDNVVSDDDIKSLTKMVLINALAIDMKWDNSFSCNNTSGKKFNTLNDEEYIATTMSDTFKDNSSYYIDDDVTVLSMDLEKYENTQLEYIAIMPNNLEEYIKSVNVDKINELTNKLISASDTKDGIDVTIPKYKFDYELKLKEDLNTLGIKDAFDNYKADFSKISNVQLYVSAARHKANIDFSEDGIKATAATVILFGTNGIQFITEPIKVTIDKPFMFIIRDKQSKEIWFVGTVYEPNLWEDDKEEYEKTREW